MIPEQVMMNGVVKNRAVHFDFRWPLLGPVYFQHESSLDSDRILETRLSPQEKDPEVFLNLHLAIKRLLILVTGIYWKKRTWHLWNAGWPSKKIKLEQGTN